MYFPKLKDFREDTDLLQKDITGILGISQSIYSRGERGIPDHSRGALNKAG